MSQNLSDIIKKLPDEQQALAREMLAYLLATGHNHAEAFVAAMMAKQHLDAFRVVYACTPATKRQQRSAQLREAGLSMNATTAAAARKRIAFLNAILALLFQALAGSV